jgi:hypothetical protein
MPRSFELEEVISGAQPLLSREGGFGSLRIWSAYKVPGFVLMRNRTTGVVCRGADRLSARSLRDLAYAAFIAVVQSRQP